MNFQELQERLRAELYRRTEEGRLTGTALAERAGFRQAHISNFLNQRRALSLDGLDKVMAAEGLRVEDLIPLDLSAAAEGAAGASAEVPVVTAAAAMEEAEVRAGSVVETIQVAAGRLTGLWSQPSARRAEWQRFVAVRADGQQAAAMEPVIAAGAIVVIDRHATGLGPARAQRRPVYAVRTGSGLALRYVDLEEGRLILRPLAMEFPVQVVELRKQETAADYVVGRVCFVMAEM